MNILLHACCAPCSIMPSRLIAQEGHTFTVFFENSNIFPEEEYKKRLEVLKDFALHEEFDVIESPYNPKVWESVVAPLAKELSEDSKAFSFLKCMQDWDVSHDGASLPESVEELLDDENRCERCRLCYRMRLRIAAHYAKDKGYDALSTTLAVSPYQFSDIIHEELEYVCHEVGIQCHFFDYRPFYQQATQISRDLGMYRQNYCGCRFSIIEGEATRAYLKLKRKYKKYIKKQQLMV